MKSIDLKKLLCVSDSTKEKSDRLSYSKETLIILSRNSPCHSRPDCLSEDCLGEDGLWDPERWHQTFGRSSSSEGLKKLVEPIEPKEESNVVLGPQRRSFQGGCHVASKEKPTSYSRSVSTSSSKIAERGSKLSHQPEHEPHSKRFQLQNGSNDWSRKEGDNKKYFDKMEPSYSRRPRHSDYKRYVPPNASRKYNDMGYRNDEEIEPEWISFGPKSQSDTIELSGFDGPADDFSWMGGEIPMDDVPERKKKHKNEPAGTKEPVPPAEDAGPDVSALEDKPLEEIDAEELLLEAGDKKDNVVESNDVTIEKEAEHNDNVATTTEAKINEVEPSLDSEMFAAENDSNKGSRFSRWFSQDSSLMKNDPPVPDFPSDEKFAENLTSNLLKMNDEASLKPILQPTSQAQKLQQQHSQVEVNKPAEVEPPVSSSQPTAPRSLDPHGTDAFNRLIASIRATDKVKEQMQQRNQKIQALQTMMNSNKPRAGSDCYNLSSIETPLETSAKNLQSKALKLQLEKQKDAYQQKIRQIEQQSQKSSPTMFPGPDMHPMQMNKGMHPGFTIQNSNTHIHDAQDERAAATASFAAKLAGKSKDDSTKLQSNSPLLDRLYANQPQSTQHILNEQALREKESLAKLQRLNSNPSESSLKSKPFSTQNKMTSNSLIIAQMLASAGVTEEQLKQLTIDQQEMVIKMVQNQYSHKDIGKMMNLDLRNIVKLPDAASASRTSLPVSTPGSAVSFASGTFSSKPLPVAGSTRKSVPNAAPTTTHALSYLSDTSTALPFRSDVNVTQGVISSAYQQQTATNAQAATAHTRLLSRNLLPVSPAAIMSPVVPIVSPNIAQRMMTPHHLASLVQAPNSLPPHPAVLMQLQQFYHANQLAAVQQQHQQQAALAVALQKQQLAAAQAQQQSNEAIKLQQSVQNMRLGSSRPGASDGVDRGQFNNPLAQWFSSDVLRQSQFPPVSQLTGQQTMKLSNNPHGVDSAAHSTKQH